MHVNELHVFFRRTNTRRRCRAGRLHSPHTGKQSTATKATSLVTGEVAAALIPAGFLQSGRPSSQRHCMNAASHCTSPHSRRRGPPAASPRTHFHRLLTPRPAQSHIPFASVIGASSISLSQPAVPMFPRHGLSSPILVPRAHRSPLTRTDGRSPPRVAVAISAHAGAVLRADLRARHWCTRTHSAGHLVMSSPIASGIINLNLLWATGYSCTCKWRRKDKFYLGRQPLLSMGQLTVHTIPCGWRLTVNLTLQHLV